MSKPFSGQKSLRQFALFREPETELFVGKRDPQWPEALRTIDDDPVFSDPAESGIIVTMRTPECLMSLARLDAVERLVRLQSRVAASLRTLNGYESVAKKSE